MKLTPKQKQLVKEYIQRLISVTPLTESKIDNYVDEINDILSSGQDGELMAWHKEELDIII